MCIKPGRTSRASLRRALAFGCLSLVVACDRTTARERASVVQRAAAEERARLDAEGEAAWQARLEAMAALEENRGEPPRPLDSAEFEELLSLYCVECHEPRALDGAALQFETVEDLITLDRIVPGDAAESRVMIRVRAGEMPPPQSELPALSSGLVELMAKFIDGLPAPRD